MQLDHTAIAIRERSVLEILDLSLHVARKYLGPLTVVFTIGIAPFFIFNRLLLGFLVDVDPRDYSAIEYSMRMWRYVNVVWMLTVLQAPLATSLAITWLGKTVFADPPTLRQTLKDTFASWGPLFLCQGIVRCSLVAPLIAYLCIAADEESAGELPLLIMMLLVVGLVRGLRPFLPEIILLEKNPLRGKSAITINKRNSALHSAASGRLFVTGMTTTMLTSWLAFVLFYTLLFFQGVMLNSWQLNQTMLLYCLPASIWLCVMLFTVFRFLYYLDLRIRQEGWAVELRMRSEAAKLQGLAI